MGAACIGSNKMALPHEKAADKYGAKRICEAERKRKESKAGAKGSMSEWSQYALTCSIFKTTV